MSDTIKSEGRARARKRKRLEQITRTAVSLFYRFGYLNTSTRQIAEACGISKGNLYNYIRSKEDLLTISIEISSEQIAEFARSMIQGLSSELPSVVLVKSIKKTIQMIDDLQEMVLFWYRESGHIGEQGLDKLVKQDMYTKDLYKKILEEGIRQGEFTISDPMLAAFEITMLCDMWSLKRWYLRQHYTMDKYIEKCQEIALAIALGINEPDHAPLKAKSLIKSTKTTGRRVKRSSRGE